MTDLMICKLYKNCKNMDEKCSSWTELDCKGGIPHKKGKDCSLYLCDGVENGACVPYICELKKGDKVRVISRTVDCKNEDFYKTLKTIGIGLRSIHKIDSIAAYKCSCGSKLFGIFNSYNERYLFHEKDLELIEGGNEMPDELKYKYLKVATIENLYESASGQCFYAHLADLMKCFHPKGIRKMLEIEKFIKWAEQDPVRIEWLLGNSYIIETQSEYNKWIDECPITTTKGNMYTAEYIRPKILDWAKRMPPEESI